MAGHDIIVIGASAGGVDALRALVGALPPDLPAAVFVVIHISPGVKSFLPTMLSNAGLLPARHATDGEPIQPGRIYVAPPDRHMVLREGHVHLSAGPKENRTRPAVNPLFRSAAAAYGPRVIGVVLSGALDDGTAGMLAIERRGGITVVQDPDEALFPSMPRSVVGYVGVDYVVSVADMPELLTRLASEPAAQPPAAPDPSPEGENRMGTTGSGDSPGAPSGVTCPECRGVLWEERDGALMEFRCRIGHRFSPESLMAEQDSEAEVALASTLRSFEEAPRWRTPWPTAPANGACRGPRWSGTRARPARPTSSPRRSAPCSTAAWATSRTARGRLAGPDAPGDEQGGWRPDERLDSMLNGMGAPPESPEARRADEERTADLAHNPPPPMESAMGGTSDAERAGEQADMEADLRIGLPDDRTAETGGAQG